MPSNAYLNFLHMRIDVLKLIETHSLYTKNKRGRQDLGYLTRSAVVMLCAAWERYNEDLLLEAIGYLCSTISDIHKLNMDIKKTLSSKVRHDKNEIKPIELAGSGWKNVWLSSAIIETEKINTPKSFVLNELYKAFLGVDKYTDLWKASSFSQINDFVADRGEIAHNGNRAKYITMNKLRKYQDLIVGNVIEIDSNVAVELKKMSALPSLPWKQEYYTDIKRYQ